MAWIVQLIFLLMFATSTFAVDLTDATLKELVSSRPDLVSAIQAGEHEGRTETQKVGNVWTELQYDADDNLVGRRVDTYSYYPTGEVDIIKQQRFEGEKLVQEKQIKHFLNGKQPTVTNLAIPIGEIPKL